MPFFGLDILLVWGWIGGPLGLGLGYLTFITVAHRRGARWADQLTHATRDTPTALRQRQLMLDEQIDATIQAAIATWTKDPARVEHCPACQGPLMVQPSVIGMPTDAPPFYRVSCRCRRCSGTFKARDPSSSTRPG